MIITNDCGVDKQIARLSCILAIYRLTRNTFAARPRAKNIIGLQLQSVQRDPKSLVTPTPALEAFTNQVISSLVKALLNINEIGNWVLI